VAGAAFALLIAGGGWLTLSGSGPTLGDYATFILLATRMILPLFVFGMLINQFQRSEASAARIWGVLSLTPAIADKPGSVALAQTPLTIRFEDVRFAYPDREPVINGVNFTLERGKVLGVVGPTGAGKSTLVKLLLRHLDPASGRIALNGRDISEFTLESLRRHMGYVSQDAFLFAGSAADNIRLGAPEATDQALEDAARIAGALEFIQELPQGFATPIGEGGVKLSGGQRQRISLARAVLRNPDILVLDEATSAVDTRTEGIIQHNLHTFRENRMTLAVAHRLSTVRLADEIIVVVEGVIVERGRHDDLLAQKGVYSGLWAVQSGEGRQE
jgi:ATP-binding cassette subfamily B protein